MTVPYLIEYTPYQPNGYVCQSIEDMVFVGLYQTVPISYISYAIGSVEDIELPLIIKNITNSAKLDIALELNSEVFLINNKNIDMDKIVLDVGETVTYMVKLNKNNLNNTLREFDTAIKLTIKNIENGGIVTRDLEILIPTPELVQDTIPLISFTS